MLRKCEYLFRLYKVCAVPLDIASTSPISSARPEARTSADQYKVKLLAAAGQLSRLHAARVPLDDRPDALREASLGVGQSQQQASLPRAVPVECLVWNDRSLRLALRRVEEDMSEAK